MRALLAAAVLLLVTRDAAAAPAADMVVYWATPDASAAWRDEASAAARRAGAAFVDASPAAAEEPAAPRLVARAIAAYGELRFDDAIADLDRAAAEIDRTGGAGLSTIALADLHLFRGLARIQRGDADAWYDIVAAARIDPARRLDPARFPPRAIEQLARAQAEVAGATRYPLTVEVKAPCEGHLFIDGGAAAPGRIELPAGPHWVHVECPGHARVGGRVSVYPPGMVVNLDPRPIAPPADAEALIQARAVGAPAVVDVVIAGGIMRARRRRADGRELDRLAVALRAAPPGTVDAAVTRVLAPTRAAPPRWYRSRWAWAAGGVLVATAILVPLALAGDDPDREIVVRPTGWPPW